ncbi:MAG: CBS domain-containing protein [Ignavibacteriae bacterium]|nr:CBS domain-containing protein [Ignavibacteriota bacterium]
MFAAVSSAVVSRLFMKQSIYTIPLEREGIEIGYGINLSIIHRVTVGSIMRKKFTRVSRASTMRELLRLVELKDQTVIPVADEKDVFVGLISFQDLRPALRNPDDGTDLRAEDIMVKDTPVLLEHDSLDKALKTFELIDIDALPVVADAKTRKIIGMVYYDEALRRYRKEVLLRSER